MKQISQKKAIPFLNDIARIKILIENRGEI